MKHRILLVDDHPFFRAGVRAAVAMTGDLEIVAEAGDARAGLRLVETLRPDVVVLDVALPGTDGIAAAGQLAHARPRQRVLMLSVHKGADYVRQALAAGALGYVSKDEQPSTILEAIRTVASGEHFLPPQLADAAPAAGKDRPEQDAALESLSAREGEVFRLIVRGLTSQEIARDLFISIKTVETHRARINAKLGVHSTGEIVRFAAARGILPV